MRGALRRRRGSPGQQGAGADGSMISTADGDRESKVIAESAARKEAPKTRRSNGRTRRTSSPRKNQARRIGGRGQGRPTLSMRRATFRSGAGIDSSQTSRRPRALCRGCSKNASRRGEREAGSPGTGKGACRYQRGCAEGGGGSRFGGGLRRKAAKYEAPKEDPHAWMSSSDRRALPRRSRREPGPDLRRRQHQNSGSITLGHVRIPRETDRVALSRSVLKDQGPRTRYQGNNACCREIADLASQRKLGPKFATISASPVEPHRPFDGRLWKNHKNVATRSKTLVQICF